MSGTAGVGGGSAVLRVLHDNALSGAAVTFGAGATFLHDRRLLGFRPDAGVMAARAGQAKQVIEFSTVGRLASAGFGIVAGIADVQAWRAAKARGEWADSYSLAVMGDMAQVAAAFTTPGRGLALSLGGAALSGVARWAASSPS